MKRLLTLITLVFALSVQAQDKMVPNLNSNDNKQHMRFMGMKMGGKLSTFVNNLREKGFTVDRSKSNNQATILFGKFAGHDDTMLLVYPNADGNVYLVGVVFPSKDTWPTLYSDYLNTKNLLIQKYGEPHNCEEKFDTSYPPSDDRDRMYHTRMERCKYSTTFNLPEGKIIETIATANMICYVSLIYGDEAGYTTNQENAIDDL